MGNDTSSPTNESGPDAYDSNHNQSEAVSVVTSHRTTESREAVTTLGGDSAPTVPPLGSQPVLLQKLAADPQRESLTPSCSSYTPVELVNQNGSNTSTLSHTSGDVATGSCRLNDPSCDIDRGSATFTDLLSTESEGERDGETIQELTDGSRKQDGPETGQIMSTDQQMTVLHLEVETTGVNGKDVGEPSESFYPVARMLAGTQLLYILRTTLTKEYPLGATAAELMKDLMVWKYFVSDAETQWPPGFTDEQFLQHCPGIKSVPAAHKATPELGLSSTPMRFICDGTYDDGVVDDNDTKLVGIMTTFLAAIEVVSVNYSSMEGAVWPEGDQKCSLVFLTDTTPKLQEWINYLRVTEGKDDSHIAEKLQTQLYKLGCMHEITSAVIWDIAVAARLLNIKQSQGTVPTSLENGDGGSAEIGELVEQTKLRENNQSESLTRVVPIDEKTPSAQLGKYLDGSYFLRILQRYVSGYPQGVDSEKLLNEVVFFRDFANAAKLSINTFMCDVFLRECPGIKTFLKGTRLVFFTDKNYVEGRTMLEAEAPDCPLNYVAIVELVHVLHFRPSEKAWPETVGGLSAVISLQGTTPWLKSWMMQKQLDPPKLAMVVKEELRHHGCVMSKKKNKSGKRFTWEMKRIHQLLHTDVDKILQVSNSPRPQRKAGTAKVVATSCTPNPYPSTGVMEKKVETLSDSNGDTGIVLVDTQSQLAVVRLVYPFHLKEGPSVYDLVGVDCEGVPESLYLIQVGTRKCTYVFDCVALGVESVCEVLRTMLLDDRVLKLFHDLHNDAAAFAKIGGLSPLRGTIDTQLAAEFLSGNFHMEFQEMLTLFGEPLHPSKNAVKSRMNGGEIFSRRPLRNDIIIYAADDVRMMLKASGNLQAQLGSSWNAVQRASDTRAREAAETCGARQIVFDVANGHKLASMELLKETRSHDIMSFSRLEVSEDMKPLLGLLPEDLRLDVESQTKPISDIVLDKGRRPLAWIDNKRVLLGNEGRLVDPEEILAIADSLGGFGTDNRAGLEKQLHRISAIRNRERNMIGLTLRVGRHVSGNTGIISDLLFADPTKSILFMGEPGSGKTTVVREATRLLAEQSNVCIVDTSNEIAGDGDIPHPCVGFSRRMMVPSLDQQSAIMIECVQNHTPEIMVIDEIGRPTEVEAAKTCKNRGVRLVASAHGDLRKLLKNTKLRGLVGGVETVTLGDMAARLQAKKIGGEIHKVRAERAGPPTFDIIVELRRGEHHSWKVILDVAGAVDSILEAGYVKAQRRTRNPETGAILLQFERA